MRFCHFNLSYKAERAQATLQRFLFSLCVTLAKSVDRSAALNADYIRSFQLRFESNIVSLGPDVSSDPLGFAQHRYHGTAKRPHLRIFWNRLVISPDRQLRDRFNPHFPA